MTLVTFERSWVQRSRSQTAFYKVHLSVRVVPIYCLPLKPICLLQVIVVCCTFQKKESFVKQFMKQLSKEIARNNENYKSQMMKHRWALFYSQTFSGVTRGGGGPPRATPSRGWHTNEINFFVAELIKKSGQTTLEGGEGGSGDETRAKKGYHVFQWTMTKKVVSF